jgi:hypothetical protein
MASLVLREAFLYQISSRGSQAQSKSGPQMKEIKRMQNKKALSLSSLLSVVKILQLTKHHKPERIGRHVQPAEQV